MATRRCDACRHDVPAGRWCNWCGAPSAREPRPAASRGPDRWTAVAATLVVGVVGALGAAVVAGDGQGTARPDEAGVVVDDRAARPVPEAPVQEPGPRTEVRCSDLRVRAVPSGQLATTEVGELVDLAHGPCVVMGPEGARRP